MLAIAPVIIEHGLTQAPAGVAHLIKDHAKAILDEWSLALHQDESEPADTANKSTSSTGV
jgi:hypothetical protein